MLLSCDLSWVLERRPAVLRTRMVHSDELRECLLCPVCASSSVVERCPDKTEVVGPIPTWRTKCITFSQSILAAIRQDRVRRSDCYRGREKPVATATDLFVNTKTKHQGGRCIRSVGLSIASTFYDIDCLVRLYIVEYLYQPARPMNCDRLD